VRVIMGFRGYQGEGFPLNIGIGINIQEGKISW